MTIKLKDFIRILSMISTIITGIVEIVRQVNLYQEKKDKVDEKKK
jgi:hypothetical protein